MKKHLSSIVIAFIFIVGLGIFLYPVVSEAVNARNQSRAYSAYHDAVGGLDAARIEEALASARAYNQDLPMKQDRFRFSEEEHLAYESQLSIALGGIMGTLEIDNIDVRLPIYHGTSEGVLQVGAGHFEGTSLPVGGEGTHTVITGHRGLPSSTLLTNLDRMAIGDQFVLRILNETLTYQVDQILEMVEPTDFSALAIEPDMDYCTLLTCTPYGINSHRLLVRGRRIETKTPIVVDGPVYGEAGRMATLQAALAALALIAPAVVAFQLYRLRRRLRQALPIGAIR